MPIAAVDTRRIIIEVIDVCVREDFDRLLAHLTDGAVYLLHEPGHLASARGAD